MAAPKHIAIILDGNGRWAKSKGMPRTYGHSVGAKNVETICRAAYNLGVEYVTMYAFSTENWARPQDEVDTLMKLLQEYLEKCRTTFKRDNMRFRVIGDVSKLSDSLQNTIALLEKESMVCSGLTLTIAINYGSRDEIKRAVNKIVEDKINGSLEGDITEDTISSYLDTYDLPDPDLMIRTSGEQRLSNYLLWQLAYSEFYFTDVPWPAFDENELKKAIEAYENRDRRYGKVK